MRAPEKQVTLVENLIQQFNGDKNQFVSALSDTLSIGKDGVYRRLRGETALTLHDMELLSQKFHFSVDQVLRTDGPELLTQYQTILDFNLEDYLEQMKNNFFQHTREQHFKIYFNARELPIFYLFKFPELVAFKYFFWQHTFFKKKEIEDFNPYSLTDREIVLSEEILETYNQTPSVELWGQEILNATLKQIKFFFEIDQINSQQTRLLIDCVEKLTDYLEGFTEAGVKPAREYAAPVTIYSNEILVGENTVVATNESKMRTYLSQNIVSLVIVDDENFCSHTLATFNNIAKKSTLISDTSEKNRIRFFKKLRREINRYKEEVEVLAV